MGSEISSFTGNATGGIFINTTAYTSGYYRSLDFGRNTDIPLARIGVKATDSGSYLQFGTSNNYATGITNTAMTINMVGNVGIGTSTPETKLDVDGTLTVRGTGPYISFEDALGNGKAYFGNSSDLYILGGGYVDESSLLYLPDPMRFKVGNNLLFVNSATGNVGVGTAAPSEKLQVVGNVIATAYLYSSDRDLKKNIKTLNNSLDKVLQLRGVSFEWKNNNVKGVGLVAQEVERIFPELVSDSGGSKAVQYGNLIAPLIEAIKEQQQKIDNLETRITILEMNRDK